MTIEEKLKELSKDLPTDSYYLIRPKGCSNCIVYTYSDTPVLTGDMQELGTKYLVLFNVYSTDNKVEETKKLVKAALKKHGFKKKTVLNTIAEEKNLFNTPMQYMIAIKE